MKKRLDQLLVDLGLAPSKTKAQELIEAGQVILQPREKTSLSAIPKTLKSAFKVDTNDFTLSLADENILQFVSRGGRKLDAAIERVQLNVKDFVCLDIGISTGGFTDCLLQRGAKHVFGVDVAKEELAQSLRKEKRLTFLSGVNARDLASVKKLSKKKFQLVVIDVSFIPLSYILPEAFQLMGAGAKLLALVKPQFEVGSVNLNKKGVVKSKEAQNNVELQIKSVTQEIGFKFIDYFPSEVKGRDGNQEYFIYAEKP